MTYLKFKITGKQEVCFQYLNSKEMFLHLFLHKGSIFHQQRHTLCLHYDGRASWASSKWVLQKSRKWWSSRSSLFGAGLTVHWSLTPLFCCLQNNGEIGCIMLGPSCTFATFQLVEWVSLYLFFYLITPLSRFINMCCFFVVVVLLT